MKIDEESINHNAVRLIREKAMELYELTNDGAVYDRMRVAMLGEIRGICCMAKTMQEVLKA